MTILDPIQAPKPTQVAAGNMGSTASQALTASNQVWLTGVLTAATLTLTLTNIVAGAVLRLYLSQDSTGGRGLVITDGSTPQTLTIPTAANAAFQVEVRCPSAGVFKCSVLNNLTAPADVPGMTSALAAKTDTTTFNTHTADTTAHNLTSQLAAKTNASTFTSHLSDSAAHQTLFDAANTALTTHEADSTAHGIPTLLSTKQSVTAWFGTPSTNFTTPVAVTVLPGQVQQYLGTMNVDTTFNVSGAAQDAELVIEGTQGSPARSITIADGVNTQVVTAGALGLPTTAGQKFTLRAKWLNSTTLKITVATLGGSVSAHAATHASGGGDPITVTKAQISDLTSLIFGDGGDSALVFDGTTTIAGLVPSSNTYTLTRDLWATDITINNGVTVKPAGYRFYCTGNFSNAGTINFDGNAASGATAGAAVAKTVVSNAGAAGGSGSPGNGAAGTVGVLGGSSGAGGTGAGSTAGGSAGLVGAMTAAAVQQALKNPVTAATGLIGLANTSSSVRGGASGGSGGGDGTNSGGGGGAGGGIIVVFCKTFTNTGTISAVGGAGGNASAGNCGGGGGGGGGGLLVYSRSAWTQSGTLTFTGGTAGTKTGTGTNGASGSAGVSLNVVLG